MKFNHLCNRYDEAVRGKDGLSLNIIRDEATRLHCSSGSDIKNHSSVYACISTVRRDTDHSPRVVIAESPFDIPPRPVGRLA